MQLTFIPVYSDATTNLAVDGDTLIYDGVARDLSAVPEGGKGWPDEGDVIEGPVTRTGGVIHARVVVRIGADASPIQPVDPEHWIVEAGDGPVEIPYLRKEHSDED